jgi:adenosylhomocysteine nucleosidase
MLPAMLLIVTALAEELETVLNLFSRREKCRHSGVTVWRCEHRAGNAWAARLGAGPARSAAALHRIGIALKPARVLNLGYAGALDPELKQGNLVAVDRAYLLAEDGKCADPAALAPEGCWPLAGADEMVAAARNAGLSARPGSAVTSYSVVGDPGDKRALFDRFGAAIVDMETAALARVAFSLGIPMSCVRAVSDDAQDDFLAFLSGNTPASRARRLMQAAASGGWLRRWGQWRERSLAARQSLGRVLASFLDCKNEE